MALHQRERCDAFVSSVFLFVFLSSFFFFINVEMVNLEEQGAQIVSAFFSYS